jgi:Na+-driven multidrug efflux pump
LAPQIVWIFIRDEKTIAYGKDFLRLACLATPFMISNFQKIYCLQAMGKGKESLILGIFRQGLFAIPQSGVVGPVTWLLLAEKYNEIENGKTRSDFQYPGDVIS